MSEAAAEFRSINLVDQVRYNNLGRALSVIIGKLIERPIPVVGGGVAIRASQSAREPGGSVSHRMSGVFFADRPDTQGWPVIFGLHMPPRLVPEPCDLGACGVAVLWPGRGMADFAQANGIFTVQEGPGMLERAILALESDMSNDDYDPHVSDSALETARFFRDGGHSFDWQDPTLFEAARTLGIE